MTKKLILQLVIKLIAVAVGIAVSRWVNDYLTLSERSQWTTMVAITTLAVGMIDLGLSKLIQKYFTNSYQSNKANNYWTTMWIVRLLSLIVGLPIVIALGLWLGVKDFGVVIAMFLAQFAMLCDQHFRSVLDSKGQGFWFSVTDLVAKLTLVAGLFLVFSRIMPSGGLWIYVWSAGIGYWLGVGIDYWLTRRYVRFGKFESQIITDNARQIMFLTVASLVATAYVRTDVIYLKLWGVSDLELNSYDNAFKLYEVATVAPGVLIPTIASKLKQLVDQATTTIAKQQLIKKYFGMTMVFGVGCTVAIWVFGSVGLWLVGASVKYPLSSQYLPIIALSILFLPMVIMISSLFVFFSKEKQEMQSVIATAVYSVPSYMVLVANYGGLGASIANVSLLLFDMLIKLYFFYKCIWREL